MSANHYHPAGIAAPKPRENIHDIHFWLLRMACDFDHCGIELDSQTATAIAAVSVQPIEKKSSSCSDASPGARRVGHRMTRSKGDEDRIGFADARTRYIAKKRRETGIPPQSHRNVDPLRARWQRFSRGDPDAGRSGTAGD